MKHLLLVVGLGLSLTSFATPSYKVTVNGMVCSFCAQGIEKKMKALPETKGVYVELKNHLVVVEAKDGLTVIILLSILSQVQINDDKTSITS